MDTRFIQASDYDAVTSVIDEWWGGRQMRHLLPRLFFEHFQHTSFVVEDGHQVIAFLIGFISQTHSTESYIHFVGVHPGYRKHGLARHLYERFFEQVRHHGCDTVRCITSTVNQGSVAFHTQMGFSSTVARDYAGAGQDYVLFAKNLMS